MMKTGLCEHIEVALGRKMSTPKDFDFLRECIFSRLNVWVSTTTLKRIWGYLKDDVQPRQGTLDILARFIGFDGYENFLHSMAEGVVLQSSPVMSRRISVQDDLKEGDRLRLFWQPNRVCELLYLGNLDFKVLCSSNTRLQTEDTFKCSLVIEGEPLYLDHLVQGGQPPTVYVCGKKSGVRYERLEGNSSK